ncbi:MAG: hypothetical protein ACJAXF_001662 [Polaribacter sp.]|jgi:hypothetical protein
MALFFWFDEIKLKKAVIKANYPLFYFNLDLKFKHDY